LYVKKIGALNQNERPYALLSQISGYAITCNDALLFSDDDDDHTLKHIYMYADD